MGKHLFVFTIAVFINAVWAIYIVSTAQKREIASALSSGVIILMGGILTMSYVEDSAYLLTGIVGGIIGTYISVKASKKRDQSRPPSQV